MEDKDTSTKTVKLAPGEEVRLEPNRLKWDLQECPLPPERGECYVPKGASCDRCDK